MKEKTRITSLLVSFWLILPLSATCFPIQSLSLFENRAVASQMSGRSVQDDAATLSPEYIASLVREKKVKELQEIWQKQDKYPLFTFFSDYTNFSVQRLHIETNSPDVEYAMVIVAEEDYKRTWQYLLFKREGTEWRFFDYIQLDGQKYLVEPRYQIVNVNGADIWLIVRWLANSGTGYILYEEDWYKLNSEKLKVALRYPVNGHEEFGDGIPPAHVEFKGELAQYQPDSQTGIYTIDVLFDATYINSFLGQKELPDYYQVFSIERKARYLWNEEKQRFFLDPGNSNVSEDEINKLFHYNADEFLKYTYDELLELATTGNNLQKKWLELTLEQAKDNPEKQMLLKQLKM